MTDIRILEEVLGPSHVMSILLYVRDRPGCTRSDVYRDVTRNANTLWKMRMLEAHGLLDMSGRGPYNSCLLRLTERGERAVELLEDMSDILNEG